MITKVSESTVAAGTPLNRKTDTRLRRPGRFYFAVMAALFIIIALAGFVPSYQNLDKRIFPLHWFAHVHGSLMAGWLLVFLTQSILAAKGDLKIHRQLGQFSVGLGILVWISMGVLSFLVLLADNPPIDHFLFDVLIIQLYLMGLFGVFFAWGILVRKNSAAHKRLLFLATLILIQAAIDRMGWLPWLHDGLSIRFYYLNAFILSLCIYDLITLGRIHKITWTGALMVVAAQVTVVQLWRSPAWHSFWFNLMNEFR